MTPSTSPLLPPPTSARAVPQLMAKRLVAVLVLGVLFLSACGVPSASENRIERADGGDEPTSNDDPSWPNTASATTTPTPIEIPTIVSSTDDEAEADDDDTADAADLADGDRADGDPADGDRVDADGAGKGTAATATPTPPPIPRLTPSPTPTPQPSSTPSPSPTAGNTQPAPTSTPVPPTATAVPPTTTPVPLPVVSCSISPNRVVGVQEELVFRASSQPTNAAIDYVFDHGDGTLDPGAVSNAYYLDTGVYEVLLRWSHASGDGVEVCGQVQVAIIEPECRIGLGPADGLGWWCGNVFCREGATNPAPVCPDVAPYGCYIGMDGREYCIDPPGGTRVSCSISDRGPIDVNEIVQFRAIHESGPTRTISFAFDHGDGTIDPGAVSDAFYAAPGRYVVKLNWQTPNDKGTVTCGTVTVVSDKPVCLVGQGPADGTAWICDGKWCNPASPFRGCPPYPIYGCHPTVQGPTICIDPAPAPVVNCTISKNRVAVGEQLTFTAVQTGSQVPVDFAFDHGDGTIDRRQVSQAYYAAPGTYSVSLTWSYAGGTRVTTCGTVVVV